MIHRSVQLLLCVLLLSGIVSCRKYGEPIPPSDPDGLLLYATRGTNPGIYDQQGRFVLLRGVNLNVLGDYWEANPSIPAVAPYDPDQFRIMASYGFNCVRLLFHWSKLEPVRGVYNETYIREIQQAIEDAARHGIYIMLDMHQDAWSKYIATPRDIFCEMPSKGWDGAPDWATFADGQSTCTTDGSRESAPAVYRAFRNFWDNREGIQDACIAAWQHLVKATAHYPTVVGYDLLNEPSLGDGPLDDQQRKMEKYHGRLVRAIRQAEQEVNGFEHIIFFETSVTWAGNPVPTVMSAAFTSDRNIVFSPHNYFEVITQGILTIEQGFALYDALSKQYQTTMLVGEWGVFGDPAVDVVKLKRFAAAEDFYLAGSTWWQWCQAPGDPHGINWEGNSYSATSMHLVEVAANGTYTGNRNHIYLDVLSRARPLAIPGKPFSFTSNSETGEMTLTAVTTTAGLAKLWIPDRLGTPVIAGQNIGDVSITPVEGGFTALVNVSGNYAITVNF
jgi:endoglycosylceramidase